MSAVEEPRKRKRRRGGVLLTLLLVLLILAFAADRVGAVVAERTVATQAQSQLASEDITTPSKPDVTIKGFPFLTQVTSGHYDEIDIAVHNPTSHGVRLDDVDVVATGVDAPMSAIMNGNAQITADKVTGVAHIGWTSFQQMIDLSGATAFGLNAHTVRVTSTQGGKIQVSAPVTVLGQTFTAQAVGSVAVNANTMHVTIDSIKASGVNAPSGIDQQLNQIKTQLTFDVKIPPLPYHLSVDSVVANGAGIAIKASAAHVALAK